MENLSRDTAARLNTRYFTILNHFFAHFNTPSTSDTRNLASTSATKTENALWVDRYRPQRFIELVGDDRVHREVMAWVKEWDWCVFGNKKGKKRPREDESLDEWKRPKEKVTSSVCSTRQIGRELNNRIFRLVVDPLNLGSPRTG